MRMTSARWVRTWICYAPILPILCLCICIPSLVFSNCIREINYSILETRTHAIEQWVDVNALTTDDLLRGKNEVMQYDINVCIDQNGYLTRTKTRTELSNSFYPSSIYTMVYSSSGFAYYDKDGVLISNQPNSSTVDIPGIDIPLTSAQINSFGLNINFQSLNNSLGAHIGNMNGFTQWSIGAKNYYSSTRLDAVVSIDDLYYLTSSFDDNSQLKTMQVKTYQERNGNLIPQHEIQHEYDDLSIGTLQSSTQRTYLSYEVFDNGQPLVQFLDSNPTYNSADSKQAQAYQTQLSTFTIPQRTKPLISLYPNPTTDILNVKFNLSSQSQNVRWIIEDTSGRIVKKGEKMTGDLLSNISVSELGSGHYIFKIYEQNQQSAYPFIIAK